MSHGPTVNVGLFLKSPKNDKRDGISLDFRPEPANLNTGTTFAVIASRFIFSSLGLQFFLDKNLVVVSLVANGFARAVKYL